MILGPTMKNPETAQKEENNVTVSNKSDDITSLRENAILLLTSNNQKIWRFEKVILSNENGTFDISENFNSQNDELLFRYSNREASKTIGEFQGTSEWRRNNSIAYDAVSTESAKLEYYILPKTYDFKFKQYSGSEIIIEEVDFELHLNENNRFKGVVRIDKNASIEVLLVEKKPADYPQPPTGILNFDEVFKFKSDGIDKRAADMVGSISNNSFYIVTRDDNLAGFHSDKPEQVIRYDFGTGDINEKITVMHEFVSKKVFVYKNELKVVVAQRMHTYDLNLRNELVRSQNYSQITGMSSAFFTTYGAALAENSVFIVGGGLGNDYELVNKIYEFDLTNETMIEFATMSENSFGAGAEIVGNKLYVFGKTSEYYSPEARSNILIYDLSTSEFTTSEMTRPVNFTFTGKTGSLLYVGGRIDSYNTEGIIVDRDPSLECSIRIVANSKNWKLIYKLLEWKPFTL